MSFEARDSNGQVQYPLGEQVSGLLVYDAAGNMAAYVMKNDLPLFAANDPDRGTDAEVRAAFEASYFGTYTPDPATQSCHQSLPWLISFSLDEKNTPNEYGVRNPHANRKCNQVNLFERHRLLCFFNNFLKTRIAAQHVPVGIKMQFAIRWAVYRPGRRFVYCLQLF